MANAVTELLEAVKNFARKDSTSAETTWLDEVHAEAHERFQSIPSPKRTDESWRFADIKQLDFDRFSTPNPASATITDALVAKSHRIDHPAAHVVFVNDYKVAHDTLSHELEAIPGLICLPFSEAVQKHGELVRKHFMTQEIPLGSAKWAAWHQSQVQSGLFIYIPKGVIVAKPIEVYHWLSGSDIVVFPHTLIVTEDSAQVTVIDYFFSGDNQSGLCCGVVDLVAGPGSQITYVACQNLSPTSKNLQIASTVVERDANVKSFQAQLGAAWSRSENVSHLNGAGANSDMLSISIPSVDQEIDQRTLQHHSSPKTTSDLLYKNALFDNGKSIFAGLIRVDEGAHYTDAYQTCRNLLMSDDAEANAMPGLEINADQVKCSHGSTSGQISKEDIFYFNARGIPTEAAKQLITFGFAAEVIARIENQIVEDMVTEMVAEHFKKVV